MQSNVVTLLAVYDPRWALREEDKKSIWHLFSVFTYKPLSVAYLQFFLGQTNKSISSFSPNPIPNQHHEIHSNLLQMASIVCFPFLELCFGLSTATLFLALVFVLGVC
jgi:hypothetical protein